MPAEVKVLIVAFNDVLKGLSEKYNRERYVEVEN